MSIFESLWHSVQTRSTLESSILYTLDTRAKNGVYVQSAAPTIETSHLLRVDVGVVNRLMQQASGGAPDASMQVDQVDAGADMQVDPVDAGASMQVDQVDADPARRVKPKTAWEKIGDAFDIFKEDEKIPESNFVSYRQYDDEKSPKTNFVSYREEKLKDMISQIKGEIEENGVKNILDCLHNPESYEHRGRNFLFAVCVAIMEMPGEHRVLSEFRSRLEKGEFNIHNPVTDRAKKRQARYILARIIGEHYGGTFMSSILEDPERHTASAQFSVRTLQIMVDDDYKNKMMSFPLILGICEVVGENKLFEKFKPRFNSLHDDIMACEFDDDVRGMRFAKDKLSQLLKECVDYKRSIDDELAYYAYYHNDEELTNF